jgi:site-specific DNA-methyltransferase (adenine-specific)
MSAESVRGLFAISPRLAAHMRPARPDPAVIRLPIVLNIAQRKDALELLRSLPGACTPLVFFDPQHRSALDHLKFGNEGARQRGRSELMTDKYIEVCCHEIARALGPSGYLMLWVDTYRLCEAHHLRIANALKPVDLIAWDSLRIGMGNRTRRRGDYLLVLQKPPVIARTWKDHKIPSRWPEKVDRAVHPHIKPIGLIERLIAAVTTAGDLIVDPAAGSFVVIHAARQLGRNFTGCDLIDPMPAMTGVARRARAGPEKRSCHSVSSATAGLKRVDLGRSTSKGQPKGRAERSKANLTAREPGNSP